MVVVPRVLAWWGISEAGVAAGDSYLRVTGGYII